MQFWVLWLSVGGMLIQHFLDVTCVELKRAGASHRLDRGSSRVVHQLMPCLPSQTSQSALGLRARCAALSETVLDGRG